MSRRKGERTDKHRHQSHPFQVEMQVPMTGLGSAMAIMYRAASQYSHETTGGQRSMRWCFCEKDVADRFASDFGGNRIDMPVDPRRLHIDRPDERELERRAKAMQYDILKVTAAR